MKVTIFYSCKKLSLWYFRLLNRWRILTVCTYFSLANLGYLEAIRCRFEAKNEKFGPNFSGIQSYFIFCLLQFFNISTGSTFYNNKTSYRVKGVSSSQEVCLSYVIPGAILLDWLMSPLIVFLAFIWLEQLWRRWKSNEELFMIHNLRLCRKIIAPPCSDIKCPIIVMMALLNPCGQMCKGNLFWSCEMFPQIIYILA